MERKNKKETEELTHSFYSLSQQENCCHANGHAVFNLIENYAVVAICYLTGYLNTAVNGSRMHNNDFLSECIQAILR